jgi:hypothetical protein
MTDTAHEHKIGEDWPEKAVDLIDLVVDTVSDRVIRPIILVGRAIVFGLLIASLALVIAVVLGVALLRILDVYAFGDRVWISYAILGTLVSIIGIIAWSKRAPKASGDGSSQNT